jgi:hypothetical protein
MASTAMIDEARVEAFAGHVATELGAALNASLAALGDELGLWRAMADGQPVSAAELAARTGTHERYLREWLNCQAASAFVTYDGAADTYTLPLEHALVLADDDSPAAMGGTVRAAAAAVHSAEKLLARFRDGGGVGWHEHHHGLFAGVERSFAAGYRAYLVQEWLPALDGVIEKLRAGALVADIGCGHGISTIIMAEAFPQSRFVGFDYHAASIDVARERAAEAGVADRVRFDVAAAGRVRRRELRPRRPVRRAARPGRPGRRRAPGLRRPGPGRDVHDRRAAGGRPDRGQPPPDRPPVLRVLDAAVHARLAVAARRRGARSPGRRGAAA